MIKRILVAGDYVLDNHIYEGKRSRFADSTKRGVLEIAEMGGAALVHYLIEQLQVLSKTQFSADIYGEVKSCLSIAVEGRQLKDPPADKLSGAFKAYAVWKACDVGDSKSGDGNQVWRTEAPMGFGGFGEPTGGSKVPWLQTSCRSAHDVIVLSDGGMGFRDSKELWPSDADLKSAKSIVLKTAAPLMEGSLWEHLTADAYRQQLFVVMGSTALRDTEARISTGFSWDATVESIFRALAHGGKLALLRNCGHLIIGFGSEGGLWIDFSNPSSPAAHLVYDAGATEGERRPTGPGTAFGALSCLTASVAWSLACEVNAPDLELALEGGLSAIHDLYYNGHGPAANLGAGFPAVRLAEKIKDVSCRFSRTVLALKPAGIGSEAHNSNEDCWNIIESALMSEGNGTADLSQALAERVVVHGHIALGSLPHLSVGDLMSADRREIESLRVLRRLMREYKLGKDGRRPLSLGIFGPPGAGKSFAVKEIARDLLGKEGMKEGWMEFNLSQFKESSGDLIGAFHQIRDRALNNQLPVAFFDEFDSRNYGWLQYLLAPMQDGAFQEGQITHPIGKCILIFAGGTSKTFNSFGPPEGDMDAVRHFRMVKGPDFKSRLDGFLDILGPNQRQHIAISRSKKHWKETPDPCDCFFPIRRALMIRSQFACERDAVLAIDPGLLRALLRVDTYKHGSRSIAKVIQPLKNYLPGTIHRSGLAPPQQLDLHVDSPQFLELLEQDNPGSSAPLTWDNTTRNKVAAAIHETWRKLSWEQGWLKAQNDVDFGDLSDFYKESNCAAADRLPKTLAHIGLTVKDGTNTETESTTIRLALEHNLELLAQIEHDGWMSWHLKQGWELGPKKPDTNLVKTPDAIDRKHPCLKPYLALSDADRTKDRDAIRHYPDFVEKAGMKIVRP